MFGKLRSIRCCAALLAGTIGLVFGVGSAGASTSAAAKLSGAPLVFGAVTQDTGPEAEPEWGQAMEAYVKYWNSQGGYKGHRIELIVKDAGFENPTNAADAARQLVNVDKVLAFVSNYNFVDSTVNGSFYASVPIAVVNAQATGSSFIRKVEFELLNPNGTIYQTVLAKWALSHGATKFGTLNPNLPQLQGETAHLDAYAQRISHKSVVNTTVPLSLSAADFDTAITQLKAQGVNAVFALIITPVLLQEANRQGFGPANGIKWMFPGFTSATPAASLPGVYSLSFTYPFGTNEPGIKAATKILKAGQVSKLDSSSASGYEGMIELRDALNRVHGPVTRASILTALRHQSDFALPLTPVTAHPSNPATNPEGGIVFEAKGGNWVPIAPYLTVLKP